MDDILASIRRILSDEDKAAGTGATEGVLMLDPSMMVENKVPQDQIAPVSAATTALHTSALDGVERASPSLVPPETTPSLVAPEAAAAAASSVGTLMRTLVAERNATVHRGGPSLEDLVREEFRPLLKEWLDAHLPGLVERLVRAEIERVVGRITG